MSRAQDKKWEREDDARTLARAQEIMSNKTRYSGAVKEAKIMAVKEDEQIKAMKKIAARKVTTRKAVRKKKK